MLLQLGEHRLYVAALALGTRRDRVVPKATLQQGIPLEWLRYATTCCVAHAVCECVPVGLRRLVEIFSSIWLLALSVGGAELVSRVQP